MAKRKKRAKSKTGAAGKKGQPTTRQRSAEPAESAQLPQPHAPPSSEAEQPQTQQPQTQQPQTQQPQTQRSQAEGNTTDSPAAVDSSAADASPDATGQGPRQPPPAPAAADHAPPPRSGLGAFLLHLHPARVRQRSASAGATLGLGLATLVSLAVATLSGVLLLVYYVPSVERAHASVQDLMAVVPLGQFMRNLHRWSAHAAVLLCGLHLLRTLLWGSYRGAHARVWLLGVLLLLLLAGTSFSGYLLPWDQEAFWTVTVGTSLTSSVPLVGEQLRALLLGGLDVGQTALTRFFVLHVALLPGLGALLLLLHLWRLRRAGGLKRPAAASGPAERLEPAGARLVPREIALSLAVTVVLVLLAVLFDARLASAPDIIRPDNPPKAPWFLVGLQEMVGYSAVLGGFAFPALITGLLCLLPWLEGRAPADGGQLVVGRRARGTLLLCSLVAGGVTTAAVLWWGDATQGSASWLNPATLGALAALPVPLAAATVGRDRSLALRGLLIGLCSVLLVLTVVGWWFRGPDWSLTYHPGPGVDHVAASPQEAR